jgi:glycosyltransferase involved in cell wall biosynthesis
MGWWGLVNILLLSQFYPPVVGGEERHVYNLARRLARTHRVSVATFGDESGVTERDGVRVHTIRPATAAMPFLYQAGSRTFAPPVPDPVVARALHRVIRDARPDVVHAHNWIVNSLVPLRRLTSAPFVQTLHDYSHVCATKRMMYFDTSPCSGPAPAKCARCAWEHYHGPVGAVTLAGNLTLAPARRHVIDMFLAVSRAVADRNGLPAGRTPYEVVPNFIPDELRGTVATTPPAGFRRGEYMVFIGDVTPDKGVPFMLDAYGRLPEGRLPLLIIGRTTADSPTQFPDGVTVLPPSDHDTVMQAFANAAFAVLPSVWPDPCPTTVLEAMATGRAVVTTPMGGIADMVDDGVEGLVVRPGDAQALAGAMSRLMEDPGLADKLGAAAREKVVAFGADTVVPRIEGAYQKLTAARGH